MSSTKLTVAQICAFAPALLNCHKTKLTWEEAKPYLIEHVRKTGKLFARDLHPQIDDVNSEALALTKQEMRDLVDTCYNLNTFHFTDDFAKDTLGAWARRTHATVVPTTLERIAKLIKPSNEMVILLNEFIYNVNGGELYCSADGILMFNMLARRFGAKYTPIYDALNKCVCEGIYPAVCENLVANFASCVTTRTLNK
jgi:hypothetical protein